MPEGWESDWAEVSQRAEAGAWVEDGWKPIIAELHRHIEAIEPGYEIQQVKEKFGGLRFYCTGSPEVQELVAKVEQRCWKICEYCGSTEGVTTEGSWHKTMCPTCRSVASFR